MFWVFRAQAVCCTERRALVAVSYLQMSQQGTSGVVEDQPTCGVNQGAPSRQLKMFRT